MPDSQLWCLGCRLHLIKHSDSYPISKWLQGNAQNLNEDLSTVRSVPNNTVTATNEGARKMLMLTERNVRLVRDTNAAARIWFSCK